MAWKGADGSLLVARYTRTVAGIWAVIEIEARGRELQLEYYAGLERNATESLFTFRLPAGLEVERFSYEVRQDSVRGWVIAWKEYTAEGIVRGFGQFYERPYAWLEE